MKRLLALLALTVLGSGCSTALTPAKVAPSFTEVFSGLYADQQHHLGRPEVVPKALQSLGSCRRSGGTATGPGDDWICTVQYVDAATSTAQSFEVQVKPDGCWKADGPPAAQPVNLVDRSNGLPFTNPLAEFDGCLDPSW